MTGKNRISNIDTYWNDLANSCSAKVKLLMLDGLAKMRKIRPTVCLFFCRYVLRREQSLVDFYGWAYCTGELNRKGKRCKKPEHRRGIQPFKDLASWTDLSNLFVDHIDMKSNTGRLVKNLLELGRLVDWKLVLDKLYGISNLRLIHRSCDTGTTKKPWRPIQRMEDFEESPAACREFCQARGV